MSLPKARILLVGFTTELFLQLDTNIELKSNYDLEIKIAQSYEVALSILTSQPDYYTSLLIYQVADGLKLIRHVRFQFPYLAIIYFEEKSEENLLALQAGADYSFGTPFDWLKINLALKRAIVLYLHYFQQNFLSQAAISLNQILSRQDLLEYWLELTLDWLKIQASANKAVCFAYINFVKNGELELLSFRGPTELISRLLSRSATKSSLVYQAFANKHLQIQSGYAAVPQSTERVEPDPTMLSHLAIPLWLNEQVVGVLSIEHSNFEAFSPLDIETISLLAKQASPYLQNYELFNPTLEARLRLSWVSSIGTSWGHSVKMHALTIRERIELCRKDLANLPRLEALSKNLEAVQDVAQSLLEQTFTSPLGSEEMSQVLPVNDFLKVRLRQLWANSPYKQCQYELKLNLSDEVTVRLSVEWFRRVLEIVLSKTVQACSNQTDPLVTIKTRQLGDMAEITITANGNEIPLTLYPQLLRKPAVESSTENDQELDLLVAKAIIEAYKGTLYVTTESSQDAAIVILFPAQHL
jgi:putative methionine-R-sulfoxide reductase with GAF domain